MTLPNWITLARLLLIPPMVYFLEAPGGNLWALFLFLVASLTDWVDGYLARRLNQKSVLGALLDPLADKILVTAALIGLVHQGLVPAWAVTIVLGREFLVTGLRTAAMNAGIVLAAGMSGKIKTVLQMLAIGFILAGLQPYGTWLWYLAVAMTLYSGGEYLWQTRRIWVYDKI